MQFSDLEFTCHLPHIIICASLQLRIKLTKWGNLNKNKNEDSFPPNFSNNRKSLTSSLLSYSLPFQGTGTPEQRLQQKKGKRPTFRLTAVNAFQSSISWRFCCSTWLRYLWNGMLKALVRISALIRESVFFNWGTSTPKGQERCKQCNNERGGLPSGAKRNRDIESCWANVAANRVHWCTLTSVSTCLFPLF